MSSVINVIRSIKSDLPDIHESLSFLYEVDIERYSQSLALTFGFEKELDLYALMLLKNACRTWSSQCLQGGFISPTCGPDSFFIVPNEDFVVLGSEVEWGLDKVQIDLRAVHSLANFLIAFSENVVHVTHFLIE